MKCANCTNDSFYVHSVAKGHAIHFCHNCLPSFLEPLKKAGTLTTTKDWEKTVKEAVDIVTDTPKEEPAVELEKPVAKRATKKKVEDAPSS